VHTRREVLRLVAWFSVVAALEHWTARSVQAQTEGPNPPSPTSPFGSTATENRDSIGHTSNFRAIYGDPRLRAAFFLFLKNVYNLYPEDRFHQLIESAAGSGRTDRDIYAPVQAQQQTIEPFLSQVRYALPALARQKAELVRQTLALVGESTKINGYMEIGTTGRYIGKLKSSVEISGDVVLVNATAPGYSPTELVERGQLTRIGRYVPLQDYLPISETAVADRSLDVVTNFIGFHHSPPERRDAFVLSIERVLRPGGKLLLRDHDVDSADMNHMVALAHDVFNMGLGLPWEQNQREIRNFTSVDGITRYLESRGFRADRSKRPLLQSGDPTHNALMAFVKA
jgi:SAM-dependent methyltransferase